MTDSDPNPVRRARAVLVSRLFPEGIPRLWCPTLTHFASGGQPDAARIRQHLRQLAPHARGILVPGSTGEGWEMSDEDIRRVLAIVLDAAPALGVSVLIGVLKHSVADMVHCLDDTVAWLQTRTGASQASEALAQSGVVGFTVCPPRGADLTQTAIQDGLAEVLARGWPTALYQLPQVTNNEMEPETVSHLADRYPNLYLFKDTSGADRVAQAGLDLGGVFLVRGAEGGYARFLREEGGPYDGLLLSTANVFAAELRQIIRGLEADHRDQAEALAHRLESLVARAFALVSDFSTGNPFTNANKLLDHCLAHGTAANQVLPPLLYSGVRLEFEQVCAAAEILREADMLPPRGYLDTAPD